MLIMTIAMSLLGFFMMLKPEIFWVILESWKSHHSDEPSEFYKWHTRFGGLIFLSIGIIGIVVTFMDNI